MPRSNVVVLRPRSGAKGGYCVQMERALGGVLEYEIPGLADCPEAKLVMADMLEAVAAHLRASSAQRPPT